MQGVGLATVEVCLVELLIAQSLRASGGARQLLEAKSLICAWRSLSSKPDAALSTGWITWATDP